MTLSQIYSALFTGDSITVKCTMPTYHTLRTGLIRKYRTSSEQLAAIGDTSMLDNFVSAIYDADSLTATFQIRMTTAKKRKPISYTIL